MTVMTLLDGHTESLQRPALQYITYSTTLPLAVIVMRISVAF